MLPGTVSQEFSASLAAKVPEDKFLCHSYFFNWRTRLDIVLVCTRVVFDYHFEVSYFLNFFLPFEVPCSMFLTAGLN